MPRLAKSKEDILKRKQERERQYRSNPEVKAKKREQDRLYQQRKRQQARLECHSDPLAQLADRATQREYLEEENEGINQRIINREVKEAEEIIELSVIVAEEGEVLKNWTASGWEEGLDEDDWEGGFDGGIGNYTNENGIENTERTNSRG
jgi:hypothetical protein